MNASIKWLLSPLAQPAPKHCNFSLNEEASFLRRLRCFPSDPNREHRNFSLSRIDVPGDLTVLSRLSYLPHSTAILVAMNEACLVLREVVSQRNRGTLGTVLQF